METFSGGQLSVEKEIAQNEHNPVEVGGVALRKVGTYGWDAAGMQWVKLSTNADGELKVNLETADIEIGAVEIKNAGSDQRATVNVSGEVLVKDTTADNTLATLLTESTFNAEDFATQTTLAAIDTQQTDGTQRGQVVGKTGVTADVDFVGKLKAVQPFRTSGATFVGTTIDTNFWTSAVANNGTNTQASSLLTMASSVTANGRATFKSTRTGRFIFFNPMICRMAVRIPDITIADNTRRWGAFTDSSGVPQDGFYFELSAAGVLSIKGANATAATINVASGSFNGSVSSYVVDTNVHAYEIHYFVMKVEFYIDGVLIHSVTPTTANLSSTYSLPINFVTINGASGGESGIIEVFSANTVRLGLESTQPTSYFTTSTTAGTVLKYGAGDIHSLEISNVTQNAAVTLYDNTAASGTIIWASGAMAATTQPFGVDLHQVSFQNGLTLVIAAAACNLLIIYE